VTPVRHKFWLMVSRLPRARDRDSAGALP